MKKNVKDKLSKDVQVSSTKIESGPVTLDSDGNIVIKIHATPGAKKNTILDIDKEEIRTQISCPPVDGKANTELLSFFQNILNLKKSEIFLRKGLKSRNKILVVNCPKYNVNSVLEKLNASLEK